MLSDYKIVGLDLAIGEDIEIINVSAELEMTSDYQQNGGKAHYVKHCKCA